MTFKKERIKVYDMTCTSCEKRVERVVSKQNGVKKVKASYSGQFVEIEYDDKIISMEEIKKEIQKVGYSTETEKDHKYIGILMIVAAVVLLGMNTSGFDMDAKLANASYAVLFIVGVLTSIHCVGMCGGIMLSQSINKENKSKFDALKPAFLYNTGRVTSYTLLGGVVGAIGSVFALSLSAQAGLQIFAGVFMIMMGLNMAGFSAFRRLQIKLPAAACKIQSKPRTPFLVGFSNGLMPCGPLQTMQIFALGSGSAVVGALSMFTFSLGTVPLMLTFGAISGLLSKGYTKKLLKYSGIFIIVLGITMGNRGLALAGMNVSPMAILTNIGAFGTDLASASAIKATIEDGVQYIDMTASYQGYTPNQLYVQKDIPVKWVVDGKELTGCNNTIVIPALRIQQKLQSGANMVEFTPGDEDLNFSCWMGMIRGTIKVVDDLETVATTSSEASSTDPSSVATSSEATETEVYESIYGEDINQVATKRLVKKALLENSEQTIDIKGIGYELEPLIIVGNKQIPTRFTMDLTSFNEPDGKFTITNVNTLEIIYEFSAIEGKVELEFTIEQADSYGIYVDERLLGIIEVVDDLNTVDLEEIRSLYLR
ncbi:MAG: sulfite exporter TauE/SafE family protein [Bacillota bacterium]